MLTPFNRIYTLELEINNLEEVHLTNGVFTSGDRQTSTVLFRLYKENERLDLTDCKVTAFFRCADFEIYKQDATVLEPTDGVVGVDLKPDVLVVGENQMALKIEKPKDKLIDVMYSPFVSYKVVETILDGVDAGDSRIPLIEQVLNEVNLSKEQVDKLQEQATSKIAEVDADYKALKKKIEDETGKIKTDTEAQLNTLKQNTQQEIDALKATVKTPNIQVGTVATLAAGQNATVTRKADSTDENPVFDFGIPQGIKGDKGDPVAIAVNGQNYNHANGTITLPNYLPEDGGTMKGNINMGNHKVVGDLTGNSDTATKLKTSVNINGVSFDGSTSITIEDATKATPAQAQQMATDAQTNANQYTDAKFNESKTYTDDKIDKLVNGAPGALDTLQELSKALNDDANFATTVTNKIAVKADADAVNAQLASKSDVNHNQASNTIDAMTGYAKGNASTPIETSDTLNQAIGKLEVALDSKSPTTHNHDEAYLPINGTAARATQLATQREIILQGDVSGTANFNDTANATITSTLANVNRTNATSNQNASFGGTFTAIDAVETDAKGRVTRVNTKTITLPTAQQANDTNVTNTQNNAVQAYITGTTNNQTNTGTQVFDTGVYLTTNAGELQATRFVGALSGNATTSTRATQDSAGQQINTTYIKGLSVSGKTITYTKGDGSTGTITTQDTNTTYSVGTASALGLTKLYTGAGTATDGTMTQAAINSALGGKANSSHTHNSITNQDTRNVNTTPTQMPLGLSVHLKSNSADGLNDGGTYHSTLMIKGWNDASGGPWAQMTVTANNNLYFRSSNNDTWNAWKKVSLDGHTHNYAGSSSAGGNANAAVKLATARTINGTNFDGSANITTANWGTARTLTIGAAGKSVNGSGNVAWTWNEMAVPRSYGQYGFGGNQNAITTAQFITLLTNVGAFNQFYWISRGSWAYANNQIINDTGCGNIHLAGSVVEVIGNSSNYTIRITTPTTGSGINNAEFIYVNNGADYSPGWRRQYNTKNKPTPAEIGAAASSHTHSDLQSAITSLQNELGTSKSTLESNINSIKGVL